MFILPLSLLNRRHQTPSVYYRTYAENGAIPSKNPVYSDDPYLARIPATRITPPHTAINLKKCLSGAEDIDINITTSLFTSASSPTPLEDNDNVSILTHPGPGYTPNEPMALVAVFPYGLSKFVAHQRRVNRPSQQNATPIEIRYSKCLWVPYDCSLLQLVALVYYQVFKERGGVVSKCPATSDDPYVGHISVNSISPPHNHTSIMRCISKIEELDNTWQTKLYASISSKSPISEGHISILTSGFPGSTLEDPMAFVVELPLPVKQLEVVADFGQSVFKLRSNYYAHLLSRLQPA